jgi:predicted NBD/HSP70 family sugar kinase
MYVGVDVGGTKTLVAALDDHGVIKESKKFPTPKSYEHFLLELKNVAAHLKHQDFKAGSIALPGMIDHKHGRGIAMGNLPWKNVNAVYDVEKIFNCPMALENDAKLAGLSEAMLLKDDFKRVLYITISTGIGYGLIIDGVIEQTTGDGGGRALQVEHKGKMMSWEDFAGGHAIVETYGKMAADINDKETWRKICRDLAKGMIQLIAIMEPEAIVIGGSVGTHFKKYGKILAEELKRYDLPMVKLPALRQAQRPEEAVVFGCYDYAKQVYPHAAAHK